MACSKENAGRKLPASWSNRKLAKGFVKEGLLCLEFKLQQEKNASKGPRFTFPGGVEALEGSRQEQCQDSPESSLCIVHWGASCAALSRANSRAVSSELLNLPVLGHLWAVAFVRSPWKAGGRGGGMVEGWCCERACPISRILLGKDLVAQRCQIPFKM